MTTLAYRHHAGGSWFAHLLVRAATYRVIWGLPLPLVLVVGVAAGLWLLVRSRRGV